MARRRHRRRSRALDRLDQVLLRPRPRPCLPRDRRRPVPAHLGAAGDVVARRRCRPTSGRPTRSHAGCRTGSTPANLFAAAPAFAGFSGGFDDRLVAGIGSTPTTCEAHLTPERNHRTLELYALLIAALALPEPRSRRPAEFAVERAAREPADRLRRRRRPPRALARTTTDRAALVRRRARELPPLRRRAPARLRRAAARAPASSRRDCRRPDGTIPALSDSDTGDYAELLGAAARPAGARDDLLHAPAAPARASPTAATSSSARSADRYLIFDCGPLGDGGHGHYDALSVEAWAGDRALVLDPGRSPTPRASRTCATGSAAPPRTTPSRVDGATRRRTRAGAPRCRAPQARLPRPRRERRARHPRRRGAQPGLRGRPPAPRDLRRRRVLDRRGRLDGRAPHRYDLRFHLAAGRGRRASVSAEAVSTPGCRGCSSWPASDRARGRLDLAGLRRQARGAGRRARRRRRERGSVRHASRRREPDVATARRLDACAGPSGEATPIVRRAVSCGDGDRIEMVDWDRDGSCSGGGRSKGSSPRSARCARRRGARPRPADRWRRDARAIAPAAGGAAARRCERVRSSTASARACASSTAIDGRAILTARTFAPSSWPRRHDAGRQTRRARGRRRFWPFPTTASCATLEHVRRSGRGTARALPGWPCTPRLVAYAAEQSAVAACLTRAAACSRTPRSSPTRRRRDRLRGLATLLRVWRRAVRSASTCRA